MFAARGNFINASAAGGSNDPYFDNVVLLLKGESTADSSKSNFTMTASSGDASVSTAQKKFGSSSLNFINRGRYTVNSSQSNTAFNFGTGAYTIDFWINITAKSDGNVVVGMGNWTKTNGNRWFINYNQDNSWKILREGNASSFPGSPATTLNTNTWYHIAYSRSGSTLRVFKDGALIWTVPGSDNVAYAYTNYPLTVGNDYNGTTFNNSHYIDHMRITKGVARYTAAFTPPTENDY
jgi:hypothetical protein